VQGMLKEGTKHLSGLEEATFKNIEAAKQLSSCVRTSLGPNGMNKMVINHLEKLFVTNDAATIVGELEVQHPAAKLLVMASNMQAPRRLTEPSPASLQPPSPAPPRSLPCHRLPASPAAAAAPWRRGGPRPRPRCCHSLAAPPLIRRPSPPALSRSVTAGAPTQPPNRGPHRRFHQPLAGGRGWRRHQPGRRSGGRAAQPG